MPPESIDNLHPLSAYPRIKAKATIAVHGGALKPKPLLPPLRIFYQGTLGSYVHGNKIAALVDVDIDDKNLAKDLAMHVAASKPKYIVQTDIPKAIIDEESRILRSQAEQEGKPKEIIEKIVTGKLNKHLNEITLLGQEYIKDPDLNISQLLKKSNATVNLFVRYEVGEGIEHQDKNFADEVKEQVEASK